jgi:hypothetical protein
MPKKYRYLDKDILNKINHLSTHIFKFNRTLPQDVIDALPDDKLFPIVFEMIHEHRAGKPAKPHMRIMVSVPAADTAMTQLLIDVPMPVYDVLPEIEIEDTPEPVA